MAKYLGLCEWSGHRGLSPEAVTTAYDPSESKVQKLCAECISQIDISSADSIDLAGDIWGTPMPDSSMSEQNKPWWQKKFKWGNGGIGTKGYVKSQCSGLHNLKPFSFNVLKEKSTVYLSASRDAHTPPQSQPPDISLYFDSSWLNKIGGTIGTRKVPWAIKPQREWYYVPWPDMQALDIEALMPMLTWTVQQLLDGKRIEAGCFGGHGRTGTFVACMMVACGWKGKDAIKEVRNNYCKSAIESASQEKLIEEELPKWINKNKS